MKGSLFFLVVLFFFIVPTASMGVILGDVLINEVAWMGTTNSANDEWLELFNNTNQVLILDGWLLKSADGTPDIKLKGNIATNSFYLLERTDDKSVLQTPADKIYTGALGNSGEDLLLYDESGNLIDRVSFSSGWTFGDNNTKQTMERVSLGTWQTSQNQNGTPKAKNSSGKIIALKITAKADKEPPKQVEPDKDMPVASLEGASNNINFDNYNEISNKFSASNPLGLFLIVGGIILVAGVGVVIFKLRNKIE